MKTLKLFVFLSLCYAVLFAICTALMAAQLASQGL